jgi:hypothetical protein
LVSGEEQEPFDFRAIMGRAYGNGEEGLVSDAGIIII